MSQKQNKVGHTRTDSASRQISVGFKVEDCEKMKSICEKKGLSVSSYVRSAVLVKINEEAPVL